MNRQLLIRTFLAMAALILLISICYPLKRPVNQEPTPAATTVMSPPTAQEPSGPEPFPSPAYLASQTRQDGMLSATVDKTVRGPTANRLERLAQIREAFRALAAGDPTNAIRAAKPLTDGTERETALLTLVTEWNRGELSPPRQRAEWIASLGLDAGLGMELKGNPQLAVLWANELTEGPGRTALLERTAADLVGADPGAALGLRDQVSEDERRGFSDSIYAHWAASDTAAALQWVDSIADPGEKTAALEAVRSAAPVGIGAELRMQEGGPVINQVLPGTPAELSGQLRSGDRIVALAQGDSDFVDARSLPLEEVVKLIRGVPGTPLQLQVLPADALPDTPPRTITIIRNQILFKK
jgi:hypothetical protein